MRVRRVVLVVAIVATALGVVLSKHQSRKEFLELQRLQALRDQMDVDWGRLLLEEGAWSAHGRVESVARRQLGMRIPAAADVLIVRRKTGR